LNPAFSLGAESPRGYAEPNTRNLPLLKTPRRRREWNNVEISESNKAPNQPRVWTETEIRNSSKDRIALENSLEKLESIQMEDEFKKVLVTIFSLVINSGDAKAMVRHLWKAVELRETTLQQN
jgi:hypothetical protein